MTGVALNSRTRPTGAAAGPAPVDAADPCHHGIAPDGTKVYVGRRLRTPAPGSVTIFERDLATGGERELFRRSGGSAGWSAVSPDGRVIVTATAANGRVVAGGNAILIVATSDGAIRQLMPSATAANVRFVAWSTDGRAMHVGRLPEGGQPELWRVPLDGAEPTLAGPFPFPDQITSLRVHPDGRQVALSFSADGPTPPDTVWVMENFLSTRR